jgi:hypothetical protein
LGKRIISVTEKIKRSTGPQCDFTTLSSSKKVILFGKGEGMINEEKVPQTIEEAAIEYTNSKKKGLSAVPFEVVEIKMQLAFEHGAKSDAAKEYWRAELKKENLLSELTRIGRIAIVGHCGLDGMIERVERLSIERGIEMTLLDVSNVQQVFSIDSGVISIKEEFERLEPPLPYDRKQMPNNQYKKKRRK